jgi:hypothetical protein
LATFFSLEKSGAATLWTLLVKPRFVATNYIAGNRGYFQSPNKLIFYALVLYGLHVLWMDTEVLNMSFDIEGINPAWFFLGLVLPLLVLRAWLLYGVKRHKLAHHLVSSSYFLSLWFILLTLLGDALDSVLDRDWWMVDFAAFMVLTCVYEARVFASDKSWWQQSLLTLAQLLLFVLLIALLVGLIYLSGGRVSSMEA